MTDDPKKSIDETTKLMTNAAVVFFIVILLALVVLAVYIGNFQYYPKAQTTDVWGQVGDFFGGVLNPIIGIGTIYLILISIRMQKQELQLTRTELKTSGEALKAQAKTTNLQAFEQSFFSWLSNYRDLVNSVSVTTSRYVEEPNMLLNTAIVHSAPRTRSFIQLSGLNALAHIWNYEDTGRKIFVAEEKVDVIDRIEKDTNLSHSERSGKISEMIVVLKQACNEEWDSFYGEHGYQVDGLFRTLLGLIDWIDKRENLSKGERWHYAEIIVAQLSQLELHLLFFFGMSPVGQVNSHFFEKFALFRNLKPDRVIDCLKTYRHFDKSSYQDCAFDALVARRKYLET